MSNGKKSIQGDTNIMIKDRQTQREQQQKKKKTRSLQMDWSKDEV